MSNSNSVLELEDPDYVELNKLRDLLELSTVLPYTVLIFAQARIRRLQMELDRAIDQGYVPTV